MNDDRRKAVEEAIEIAESVAAECAEVHDQYGELAARNIVAALRELL